MASESIESTALHCISGIYAALIGLADAGIIAEAQPDHIAFKAVGGMPGAFARKSGKTLIRVHILGDDGELMSTFGDATWMCNTCDVPAFKNAWTVALHSLQTSYSQLDAPDASVGGESDDELDAEDLWELCHNFFGAPEWGELDDDAREAFTAHVSEDEHDEDTENAGEQSGGDDVETV